jgi:transposase-like protein
MAYPLRYPEGMKWPRRPVEQIPYRQFRPPHCPWPQCTQHHINNGFRYKRSGFYSRLGDRRQVQRFQCKSCRRCFSQQTFACSYYAKLPRLGPLIAAGLNAGSAHRQIARTLGCTPSTVTRQAARLGRHAILLHSRALEGLGEIRENLVVDHFETFVYSQFDALGIGTAVGHGSWFVYSLDPAPHRRGGRLTPAQRLKLSQRKRPMPRKGGLARSVTRILEALRHFGSTETQITLITDAHPAYPRAIQSHASSTNIRHLVFPNPARGPKGSPRSSEAAERDRAMFPADQLHALWRHSCAHHRRETIAFGRRINAVIERAYLMAVWRNFVKWRSERKPDRSTPAMRLGLASETWSWPRVFAKRLFPTRQKVPESWKWIYSRDWDEDAAGPFVRHRLKHAV